MGVIFCLMVVDRESTAIEGIEARPLEEEKKKKIMREGERDWNIPHNLHLR